MSDKEALMHGLNIRLWATEGGVGPFNVPEYITLAKLGDPSQSRGDTTRINAPDPNNFNRDVEAGTVPGTEERATVTVSRRYTTERGKLLGWFRTGCRVDLYAMVGLCGNPQDFRRGGEKFMYFPDGQPSTITIEGFGAFGKDETAPTNENLDMTSSEFWELLRMGTDLLADAETVREILTIDVCDELSCGDCERISDGCQRVLATMVGVGATPGTAPSLLYSADNGENWNTETIATMFSEESISGAHCIGGNLVIITEEGNEIHYRDINDLFIGEGAWAQNDNGFVVGGEPLAIWSVDASHTWIVGNGGYIYFSSNPEASVSVQDPGVVTNQPLRDVHAFDKNSVIAVGDNNALAHTKNGGQTWELIIGPNVGINLSSCWMYGADTWLVGEGAGGTGRLWKTQDAGNSWFEVELAAAVDRIDKIKFVSDVEGYLAVRHGTVAKIYRTLTGGYSWWVLPDDQSASSPDTDWFNDLAVCTKDANTVFAGGLDGDSTTGIIVKGEGAGI